MWIQTTLLYELLGKRAKENYDQLNARCRSLEGIDAKIKLIDAIFDYLDKIDTELNKYVHFNETVIREQQILN